MTGSDLLWNLDDESFQSKLGLWRQIESPSAEVAAIVEEWIPTRKLDPFRGARCEREEDDFWFAQVPGTLLGGQVAVCSYWIVRADRLVRCDLFGTLSWPV